MTHHRFPTTLRARGARQRGAALLLAMLIVTLVATLAGAMVWQQWRAVQVEAAERARMQAAWILSGALDWARLILREDGRNAGSDNLGEPWAVPLAEARLSSFLAADKDASSDDGPEAFLSGGITDAQSRYNLTNLAPGGQIRADEVDVLKRLFENTGVSPELAVTLAVGLRDGAGNAPGSAASASAPASGVLALPASANPPLPPQRLAQLRWLGVDADTLRRMQTHVVLLPTPTRVNLNTASREVLSAVIDGLDLAGAQRLVQARERSPFKQVADAQAVLGTAFTLNETRVGVATEYFEVRGRLRLGDRVLEEKSLVRRNAQFEVTTLARERINSQENPP